MSKDLQMIILVICGCVFAIIVAIILWIVIKRKKRRKLYLARQNRSLLPSDRIELFERMIDIQASVADGKGNNFIEWAKSFNLQQTAKTFNYLVNRNLWNYSALCERTELVTKKYNELKEQIEPIEQRLTEIALLSKAVENYKKSAAAYSGYQECGYSETFLLNHISEITSMRSAKKQIEDLGLNVDHLPSVERLKEAYNEALEMKKVIYPEYQHAKKEMDVIQTAKANYECIHKK